jgi:hypothetical protein
LRTRKNKAVSQEPLLKYQVLIKKEKESREKDKSSIRSSNHSIKIEDTKTESDYLINYKRSKKEKTKALKAL